MNKALNLLVFILVGLLAGCHSSNAGAPTATLRVSFAQDDQGWLSGFADYPEASAGQMALAAGWSPLPAPLAEQGGGMMLSGKNTSDDLFMFIKGQIQDLPANTHYDMRFIVSLASQAPMGCVGTGGAPAESVFLKAGASQQEPQVQLDEQNWLRLNLDHGQQANSGADAIVLGHIGTSQSDCQNPQFELIQRHNDSGRFQQQTDENGRLWLLVGVDSGFESTTTVYITDLIIELRALQ